MIIAVEQGAHDWCSVQACTQAGACDTLASPKYVEVPKLGILCMHVQVFHDSYPCFIIDQA